MLPSCLRQNRALVKIIAGLWLLQLGWLAWHYAPEALEVTQRLASGEVGGAVRQEDAYYRWLGELAELLPPTATYIFIDRYEAGKYLETRYVLHPRRMVRLNPQVTPAFLYDRIVREQAEYLILPEGEASVTWKYVSQSDSHLFQALPTSGPGMVFRVNLRQVTGGFYD